jgi:hypothetical protein
MCLTVVPMDITHDLRAMEWADAEAPRVGFTGGRPDASPESWRRGRSGIPALTPSSARSALCRLRSTGR